MSWRWIRRILWVALIAAMAIVPARVAQSPENAQAADTANQTARPTSSSASVVTWIVLGTTLAAVPLVMRLRRRLG